MIQNKGEKRNECKASKKEAEKEGKWKIPQHSQHECDKSCCRIHCEDG